MRTKYENVVPLQEQNCSTCLTKLPRLHNLIGLLIVTTKLAKIADIKLLDKRYFQLVVMWGIEIKRVV